MNEQLFSLLDQFDDQGVNPVSRNSHSHLQSEQVTRLAPLRDRYRASCHEPANDIVEDDVVSLDSFDESLLRQPCANHQPQAVRGNARLSFRPQSYKYSAPAAASQPQAHDAFTFADLQNFPQLRFNQLANSATQPQDSGSDAHLGSSSSPAFRASQRRAENSHKHEPQPPTHAQPFKAPLQTQPSLQRPPLLPISHSRAPIIQDIPLVPVNDLPDRLRTIFPFPTFNAVQSKCFADVYQSDNNFVLASPTGSGKTAILELAICRAIATNAASQYKIVYQAPTKALCSERQRDWQKKFGPSSLNCVELTGDSDTGDLRKVQCANIIVTTPEKWDSITRKWKDHEKLMRLVKLFLIDEVHILKEDRGATLEAVVSRMKFIGTDVRFVALSATIPNFNDVAAWLGRNPADPSRPAISESFGEEFRPVKLQRNVCGYSWSNSNDFAFEKSLNTQLPDVITKYSEHKPIMVFCCTRNSTVATAKLLANWWAASHPRDRAWNPPAEALTFTNRDLQGCAASGVAFHHAGIDPRDRVMVEKSYLNGIISVICCTSTLAVGVNLPCHLVIIKNTVTFSQNVMQEYADLEIMQMLGRAGRPQFDDSAVAVIMTRQNKVRKYELMVSGQDTLESTLHHNLIEHVNAEIGLGTIKDITTARKWLASTFLCVRLHQNPPYYKLEGSKGRQSVDEQLDDICSRDISLLRENGLIMGDNYFHCTEFGSAMARYYVRFQSIQIFMGLQPKASISEILSAIAQASEFEGIRFRVGEKSLYKAINKLPFIRFPIHVNLDLPAHKVSLLIQSTLGCSDISWEGEFSKHKSQFMIDEMTIFKHITRLIHCIIDCQATLEDSISMSHALTLERSLTARVWDDSPLQMKQIEGLGVVSCRKLASAGIRSIEELECTDAHRIEMILGRNPPFGMAILEKLKAFPKLRITSTPEGVKVEVRADVGFISEKISKASLYVCFLAETSDGRKIYFARTSSKNLGRGQTLVFPALLTSPNLSINCHISCDGIAGTMRSASVMPKIAPSMFPKANLSELKTLRPHERPISNTSKRRAQTAAPFETHDLTDEFDNDGIDDDELMKASCRDLPFDHIDDYENHIGNMARKEESKPNLSTNRSRKKQLEKSVEENQLEPQQLENGNWACGHRCKDKGTCKHLCCKEGKNKPPKKTTLKCVPSNEGQATLVPKAHNERGKKTQTKLRLASSKRKSDTPIEVLDLTQQVTRTKAKHTASGSQSHPGLQRLQNLHKSIQKNNSPQFASRKRTTASYGHKEGCDSTVSLQSQEVGPELDLDNNTGVQHIDFDRPTRILTWSQMGDVMELDDVASVLDERANLDRHSDSFGDDDSIFVDALVGIADSEDLRLNGEQHGDSLQAPTESEETHIKVGMWDENCTIENDGVPSECEKPSIATSPARSRAKIIPSVVKQKYPIPFPDTTSCPRPAMAPLKHNEFLVEDLAFNDSSKSKVIPREGYVSKTGSSKSALDIHEKDLCQGVDEDAVIKEVHTQQAVQDGNLVPEMYKDLEPWLFEEFGNIVELVD